MDAIVELRHPFDFDQSSQANCDDERNRVFADYFWRFWRGTDAQRKDELEKEKDTIRRKLLEQLLSQEAFVLAEKFAECVGSPLVDLFSVRYVRGMAKRIRGKAVILGLQTYHSTTGMEKLVPQVSSKMTEWTREAFSDMVKARKVS